MIRWTGSHRHHQPARKPPDPCWRFFSTLHHAMRQMCQMHQKALFARQPQKQPATPTDNARSSPVCWFAAVAMPAPACRARRPSWTGFQRVAVQPPHHQYNAPARHWRHRLPLAGIGLEHCVRPLQRLPPDSWAGCWLAVSFGCLLKSIDFHAQAAMQPARR